jgi:hypothetical protein
MEPVVANLLPLIVAAAVLPAWIIITLLLLRGKGGVIKAAAFAAGALAVRLLQGILFGLIFGAATDGADEQEASVIASTLLLVVGILLLVTAVKKWRKEDDPDAPPPQWMTALGGLSALKAFGMGALLMAVALKQWVFTLSAIAVIEEAQLDPAGSVLSYLFFVLAAQSLVLAPVIAAALAPAQSARLLDATLGWLERNNRVITIAVSLIFGAWFLWKGLTGLIGLEI